MAHGFVMDHPTAELKVLRCFELRLDHVVVTLPTNVERLLAYLAVQDGAQPRHHVASHLWMDTLDAKAAANLRTALWRARQLLGQWMVTNRGYLALSAELDIDLRKMSQQARTLLRPEIGLDECDADPTLMRGDLLPDWDEEWIVHERERVRQLRVHGLEALSDKLRQAGRTGEAVDVALTAISAEPLRESAHRLLVAAHLAEGNVSEARRQYDRYRDLLWDGLGIEPSIELRGLIERAQPASGPGELTPPTAARVRAGRQIVPRLRRARHSGSALRSST